MIDRCPRGDRTFVVAKYLLHTRDKPLLSRFYTSDAHTIEQVYTYFCLF